jgi:hypothetical protein
MTKKTDINSAQQNESLVAQKRSGIFRFAVGLAVVLCIICCVLILLVPTESINVDTVYQGF